MRVDSPNGTLRAELEENMRHASIGLLRDNVMKTRDEPLTVRRKHHLCAEDLWTVPSQLRDRICSDEVPDIDAASNSSGAR